MTLNHILLFDKSRREGVDVDYEQHEDGSVKVLYVDKLKEGDVNV